MRKKGFTLIELMIVVAIVAILVVLGVGFLSSGPEIDEDVHPGDINEEVE